MTEWFDKYVKQIGTPTSFDTEVAEFDKEWDADNRKYVGEYYQHKTEADAKRYQESSMPWVVRAVQRGVQGAAEGIGAPLVGLFDPEVGEHIVRGANADHEALMLGLKQSGTNGVNGFFAKNLYGTAYSISMAAGAAGLAPITGGSSLLTMAGAFGTSEAYGSYVEAIDAGLSESKARRYAATQGAVEAIPMLVFSALGIGGAEKYFKNGLGGVGKEIFKGGLGRFGKDFVAELGEEEITTFLQVTNRFATLPELKGQDPWKGGTESPMFLALQDTFVQTGFMMGAMKTPSAVKFLLNPSRATAKELKETAPTLYDRLEETYGDLDVKENRDAAAADTLQQVNEFNETIPGLEQKLEQLEDAAADPKYASEEKQEQIQRLKDKLKNRKAEAEGSIKELMELHDEITSATPRPKPPIIDPKLTPDTEAVLPQAFLEADPDAVIVNTAHLPFGEPEAQEQVRILRLVKELSRKLRGKLPIHFVRPSGDPRTSGLPQAAITDDGIFITIPHLERYMDRGFLDSKAMRKALAGAFSHEFFAHELRDSYPEIWETLVAQLQGDTKKYGRLLEKFRGIAHNRMVAADKTHGHYTKTYGKNFSESKEYKKLLDEEALGYLLSEHFADTGLISKIAEINPTFMEKLGDWLRRIGQWMYRDKLYLGLVDAYNSVVASRPDTDGVSPIVPVTDPIAPPPAPTSPTETTTEAAPTEPPRPPTPRELRSVMSYKELQDIAKQNGIRANQSADAIREQLNSIEDQHDPTVPPPLPETAAPTEIGPPPLGLVDLKGKSHEELQDLARERGINPEQTRRGLEDALTVTPTTEPAAPTHIRITIGATTPEATTAVSEIRSMGKPVGSGETVEIDGVRVDVEASQDRIRLTMIQSAEVGTGAGTRVLNKLKGVADKHGVPITLTAEQIGDTTVEQLESWYKKNGFVEDGGGGLFIAHPRRRIRHRSPAKGWWTTNSKMSWRTLKTKATWKGKSLVLSWKTMRTSNSTRT